MAKQRAGRRRKWKKVLTLPGGHTVYGHTVFENNGRFSICDESGPNPDETDDGALWLFFQEIQISDRCVIRVLSDDDGGTYDVFIEPGDALILAAHFEWPVQSRGVVYDVKARV